MVGWEGLIKRIATPGGPFKVLGWDLGRGIERFLWVGSYKLTKQTFAMPCAIASGRIKKGAAQINRQLQRLARLIVIRFAPATHAPHAIANFAHLPAKPAKGPILHICPHRYTDTGRSFL